MRQNAPKCTNKGIELITFCLADGGVGPGVEGLVPDVVSSSEALGLPIVREVVLVFVEDSDSLDEDF